ncbi:MAG: dephospho-CoA kinase [Rhodobacteraceae bacterium]|nr:dephospho-CoA kinase [Paracoccaceae bacterium]
MSFRLGLTGSIGMGKSTTAQIFEDFGCAIWDADAAVHRLYGPGGAAVASLAEVFPDALVNGAVSRDVLKRYIEQDRSSLRKIEAIVHPLVRDDRDAFAKSNLASIIVFDIPLLFETGAESEFDAVACVRVSDDVQKSRVMARDTMTEAQFKMIRDKQMPMFEKCDRADFIIETDTLDHARAQVKDIVQKIKGWRKHA